MRLICFVFILSLFCITGFGQDNKVKAGFILLKASQTLRKDTNPIESIFVESSSRYNTRKANLKEGIIPSFEFKTKVWIQKTNQIKLRTLTNYPGGDAELRENIVSEQSVGTSIKIKSAGESSFQPFYMFEKGDPKKNEEILLRKTKYQAFSHSFSLLLFSNEDLSFEYLGVAKAGEQSADVLVTSIAETYKIKLYFDKKTSQLLLTTANFVDPKTQESIEHKYFFSDYKTENGINYAHKVIIHENGEIIEERDIKSVEINPKLEASFFKVPKSVTPPTPPKMQ